MGILDSLKSWFKNEASEATDLGRSTRSRLEDDIGRREAALTATPEQRLAQLQDRIEDNNATLDELRHKIDGREALAGASAEVADLETGGDDGDDEDLLDLPSEEIVPPEPPPV